MRDEHKRRRVMERSAALGHCICNPRQPCPCETFLEHDLCLCAGERFAERSDAPPVRLTELVDNAGCASKISQADLRRVLADLPLITDERLLVGAGTCDDAGVYRLTEDMALVQTVDVFTPCVDDPYLFGQIAAANSLSDCYAMGGTPLTALAVIGFPIETLSHAVMTQILRGGMDKVREAGALVVGGHSIKDREVKFGFAVSGTVDPRAVITNAGARPGDALVLTKPLGTGLLSFARQLGRVSAQAMAQIGASMAQLNAAPARLMAEAGAHAATDVTGFGLIGHLLEMARQSGVTVELAADRVPVFAEALECVEQQMISGAIERNLDYARPFLSVEAGVEERLVYVLHDPQTSGGLLIALPAERAPELVARLRAEGCAQAAVVGRVQEAGEAHIRLRAPGLALAGAPEGPSPAAAATPPAAPPVPADAPPVPAAQEPCCDQPPQPCCEGGRPPAEAPGPEAAGPAAAREAFGAFMGVVNAEGALNPRTKKLLALALSLLARCEECAHLHLARAREMGLSEAEMQEAAWLAIAFGGAPVLMFYNSLRERR